MKIEAKDKKSSNTRECSVHVTRTAKCKRRANYWKRREERVSVVIVERERLGEAKSLL